LEKSKEQQKTYKVLLKKQQKEINALKQALSNQPKEGVINDKSPIAETNNTYNEKLILAERLSDSNFNDNIGIDTDQDSTSYEKYMFSVKHKLDKYLTNSVALSYYKLSPGIETQKADFDLLGNFDKYGYKLNYSNRISNSSTDENTLESYYANIHLRFLKLKISPFIAKEKRMNTNIVAEIGDIEDKYGLSMYYDHDTHDLKNTSEYNIFSNFDNKWKESKYQLSNSFEYKGRHSTYLTSELIWNSRRSISSSALGSDILLT